MKRCYGLQPAAVGEHSGKEHTSAVPLRGDLASTSVVVIDDPQVLAGLHLGVGLLAGALGGLGLVGKKGPLDGGLAKLAGFILGLSCPSKGKKNIAEM